MKSKTRLHHLVKPAGTAPNAEELTEQEALMIEPELYELLSQIAELEGVSISEALARVAVFALKSKA